MWVMLTIGCMGLIAFLSLTPTYHSEGDKGKVKEVVDNIGHIPAYALLCFLWINSLSASKRNFVAAAVISILYGALMEYFQAFVPGRYPSIMDVGSDTLGALLTVFFITRRSSFPQA